MIWPHVGYLAFGCVLGALATFIIMKALLAESEHMAEFYRKAWIEALQSADQAEKEEKTQ